MSEDVYVNGLTWTRPLDAAARSFQTRHNDVNLRVDEPSSDEGKWFWKASHTHNGWCALEGEVESRAVAMKTAQEAIPYVVQGFDSATEEDKRANRFSYVWQRWFRDHPSE